MFEKLKNLKLSFNIGSGYLLMALILACVVLTTITQVVKLTEKNALIVNLRGPTARSSLMMLNGINHSLAALRGWMILGKDNFKTEREMSWNKEIEPSLENLKAISANWTNPENIQRLEVIERTIDDLKTFQQEIEDIAQTENNVPAINILLKEAAPQAAILATQITRMIDLESQQPGTPERKNILGIMADVRGTTGLGLAAVRAYLLSGESKFKDNFKKLWAKNSRRFTDLQEAANLLTPEQRKAFDSFSKARSIFDPLPPKMFASRESEDWNRANHWLGTKAAPTAAKLIDALNAMANDQKELMLTDMASQQKMATDLYSSLWVLLALGVASCLILGTLITGAIIAPIKVVVTNLNQLSHGTSDLTQRLPISAPVCSDITQCNKTGCPCYGKKNSGCWEVKGSLSFDPTCPPLASGQISDCEECEVYQLATHSEMQALAVNFNSFITKLQMILTEVVTGVVTVSSATTELSSISEQMSNGAENVSRQSDSVSVAAEEMSANMDSVAAASEQATTNMSIVASAAEEMIVTITDVNNNTAKAGKVTGEAVSEAESATSKVQELGRAASEISKVTEVITDISSQTNLLALNATIEAARAGEAGKGFAVVANEIKELAQQTAEATGQIKAKIEGIQNSTLATVNQIERITEVINNVNDTVTTITLAVEGQAIATEEIAANVTEATHGLEEVNENVAQSSVVSGQIAQDITMVSQASTDMSSSSSEVKMSAAELVKTAKKLKLMTDGFKL
jgi:methyl-accepting chemotaxis protein